MNTTEFDNGNVWLLPQPDAAIVYSSVVLLSLFGAGYTGLAVMMLVFYRGDANYETPGSAALLLSPVGKPLPRPTTRQEIRNLFGLLWQLHANGLVHGDPRVPNVIFTEEKPLWIDLVEVMEASPTLKQFDTEILTRSILSISRTVLLDPVLKQLIDNYAKSATREDLNHLAEEVYNLMTMSS